MWERGGQDGRGGQERQRCYCVLCMALRIRMAIMYLEVYIAPTLGDVHEQRSEKEIRVAFRRVSWFLDPDLPSAWAARRGLLRTLSYLPR